MNKSSQLALRVALLYCLVAGLWIIFSDQLAAFFVHDPALLTRIHTGKGLVFVAVSSIFFFVLLRNQLWKWEKEEAQRKQAEMASMQLAAIVESSSDAIVGIDFDGIITSWNSGAERITGFSAAEVVGTPVLNLIPEDKRAEENQLLEKIRRGEKVESYETARRTKDGRMLDISISISPIKDREGNIVGVARILHDVTLLKKHEREITRLSRLYSALSQVNHAIVNSRDRDELFEGICRALVERGEFRMAWIGRIDAEARRVTPVAQWGDATGYLERVIVRLDAAPETQGPTGKTVQEGKRYVCNDFARDPRTLPWQEAAQRANYRASATFPIREGGVICGALTVYSDEIGFFQDKEVALLEEAASDLSFALDNLAKDDARRRAEETVRYERDFSDAVLKGLPGIFYLYDENFKFLRWNKNFERVSGYSAAEMASMRPLDFFAGADKELIEVRIKEVFKKGASDAEAGFLSKDGRSTPYYFTGIKIQFDGQNCLLGVGINITELKQAEAQLAESERKYRELVELANSIILRWDSEGKITFLNEFGQRFFGYTSEEIVGRHVIGTIVPPTESSGRDLQLLMEQICADPAAFEYNINENICRDGKRVSIAWTNRIVSDAQGKVVEILSVGTDITERRKLEAQFRQAQKMEAIGQLASGVAHDFNNILAVIMMQAGLMTVEKGISDHTRNFAGEIEKAAQRASNLTRQLLLFSRQQTMQPNDFDLNEIVTNMAKMLQRVLGEDVQMQFKLSSVPLVVHADAGMIDQILLNLTVNARDAMPTGGKLLVETSTVEFDEVTAAQAAQARPGSFACLSVTDTGCGIPAEIFPRIFEPFFTTKDVGKGTGLGLATVFGIVQQHQGWINVYSEVDQGTTFRVYLPRLVSPSAGKALQPSSALVRGGNETILLVEDDLFVRSSVQNALSSVGYRVLEAATGAEALGMWKQYGNEIHLLLTDLVLPGGITGKEIAERLLQQNPNLKVIYSSGYSAEIAGKHIPLEEGINFLAKPFEARKLAQTVRKRLDMA